MVLKLMFKIPRINILINLLLNEKNNDEHWAWACSVNHTYSTNVYQSILIIYTV